MRTLFIRPIPTFSKRLVVVLIAALIGACASGADEGLNTWGDESSITVENNTDKQIFYDVLDVDGDIGTENKRKCLFGHQSLPAGSTKTLSRSDANGLQGYRISWFHRSVINPKLMCTIVEVHTIQGNITQTTRGKFDTAMDDDAPLTDAETEAGAFSDDSEYEGFEGESSLYDE